MTTFDAAKAFETGFDVSNYIRVGADHPLELYIGADKHGRKSLRFLGDFRKTIVNGTKSVEVKQFPIRENISCIQFSLIDESNSDLFYTFCNDIVNNTIIDSNQENGYRLVISRFERWKNMFVKKKDLLGDKQIMGLIGELCFLRRYLLPRFGSDEAVESWSASDPTLKDFSIGDTWYEVKTTGPKSSTVTINSVQQLEFNNPGILVVIRLEKMSPEFKGETLNKVVKDIIDSLSNIEYCQNFQRKLVDRGYTYDERYDSKVFQVLEMAGYEVKPGFPKLERSSLNEAIANAQYDLLLDHIAEYKISLD